MIDKLTFEQCKKHKDVLDLKIKNLIYAISQSELMIKESSIDEKSLIFLRRKLNDSIQDLEALYLLKKI